MLNFYNHKISGQTRMPAANSTFAIGGVSCSASTFVVKNPPIAKRQNVSGQARQTISNKQKNKIGTI